MLYAKKFLKKVDLKCFYHKKYDVGVKGNLWMWLKGRHQPLPANAWEGGRRVEAESEHWLLFALLCGLGEGASHPLWPVSLPT